MNQKIIIFYARQWKMTDEVTRETREGVSINYVNNEDLKPNFDSESGVHGYQISKESISLDKAKLLEAVPGIYDCEFMLKASKGKNILAIKDLKFVSEV